MSRLLVLTRPDLVAGFHLTGVDAFPIKDVESAEEMIVTWLQEGEEGLLAIDESLLALLDPGVIKRLDASARLPYLAIPSGGAWRPAASRRHRIAEMIRQALGFHITFKGEETEVDTR